MLTSEGSDQEGRDEHSDDEDPRGQKPRGLRTPQGYGVRRPGDPTRRTDRDRRRPDPEKLENLDREEENGDDGEDYQEL